MTKKGNNKKITKATFKSFIRKSGKNLLLKINSDFDGTIDGLRCFENSKFKPAEFTSSMLVNTLGVTGLWLNRSDNDFKKFETADLIGIHYSNCCGSGVIAVRK